MSGIDPAGIDEPRPVPARTAARVARNASFLAASTLAVRVLAFGLGVVIARRLGRSDYGRYGIAVALATMLLPIADLGTTPYVSREAARDPALADRLVGRLTVVRFVTSVTLGGAVAVVSWYLLDDGRLAMAIALVLAASLADGISQFAFGYFQGRERMGFEAVTNTAAAVVRTLGGIALAVATGSLLAVLLWIVAVSLVQLAMSGARLRRTIDRIGSREPKARPEWRTVAAMGVIGVFVMIYLRADTVMVGMLLGKREAGLYTAAYTIVAALQIVPWMVALALTPVFARSHGRADDLFDRSWREGLRTVLVIALPLALATALLANPIIERVFGPSFRGSAAPLAILVWACPVAALNVLLAAVMRGAGREGWLTAASAAGAVLNIGLNIWAIPTFGINGAAGTTITSEIIVLVVLAAVAARFRVVAAPRLPVVRLALALGALGAAAVIAAALPVEIRGVLALGAYGVAVLALRVVGAADVERLRTAARRGGTTP